MAAVEAREAARIYDLAAFRRKRAERRGDEPRPGPAPSLGGAWYHEAAIRAEDPNRRP